ncbi:kinesin light chain [Colletotrichum musicola]|uniref:Kinesin light chain n=1 Tax=Colletotrichum musicola TaxID=2175873 RepID=A0A8H6NDN2_9PEZI|nr:kinesin light chain [Colletotrichum musicola]
MWLVEKHRKVLGNEQLDTLISMNNLAITWKECGKREAAIRMMRDCLRGRELCLGPNHPHTIQTSSTLARWEEKDQLHGEINERQDGQRTSGQNTSNDRPGQNSTRRRHRISVAIISLLARKK